MKKNRMHSKFAATFLALASLTLVAACTVRTPTTETPPPVDATNNNGIEKTFFETTAQVTEKGVTKSVTKRKTFICGWAPISESTGMASGWMTHAAIMTNHCNIEFEITSGALIGRMVNPSFPDGNNPAHRARWKEAISIPIEQHYYYERTKDSYGRDTNELVKNSSRSHYTARPLIDLGFERLAIQDWDLAMFYNSRDGKITKVEDIEWDRETGFFAFTASLQNNSWGADIGARVRFNFKAFEHNPKFETTPYDSKNSNHLNALHVIGDRVEGLRQVWNAAKWDLSKTHDVYLHGFPDEYVPMAKEVVDQWNKTFASIDPNKGTAKARPKAFNLNLKKMKYPFDLRYPMMVWVNDPLISAYSPLGIGMAAADVRNGEIKWGQITLYGGYLEEYVKGYMEAADGSNVGGKTGSPSKRSKSAPLTFDTYFNPRALSPIASLAREGGSAMTMNPQVIQQAFMQRALQKFELPANATMSNDKAQNERLKAAQALASEQTETMMKSFREAMGEINLRTSRVDLEKNRTQMVGFMGRPTASARKTVFGEDESDMNQNEKLRSINYTSADMLQRLTMGTTHDLDRRFVDIGPQIADAISKSGVGYEAGLRKVVKELILHEFGHFLGLGHQFKENILPPKGSVPEKYRVELEKRAADNMTNASSVMGYRAPISEILTPDEHIAPGYQDELTLRYLYNRQYSTYKQGDEDFTFFQVKDSGLIPDANPEKPEYKVAYFPQCNDFHATFSYDPYCNRFDRGNDAESIVQNYFDDININKVSRIHAFTEASGRWPDESESGLWYSSLRTLGRVRIFYDYMRQKYENEIRSISQSKRDLDEFSRVCAGEMRGSAQLENLFEKSPGLKELCRVNRKAMMGMTNLLNTPGPDRTRMNWDSAAISAQVTGGDAAPDYSQVFGTYSTLSVLPLKLSAMNALTTPYPYTMLGWWMFPIPRYTGDDGLFSYSTLYSREFTAALASAIERNVKTETKSGERATIGLPILSMGYFLNQQAYGNDAIRMPKDFIESIRSQSQFRLSMKAVIVEMQNRGDKTRATQLVGTLFDPYSGKTSALDQVFMLPGGKMIVRGRSKNFIYPISKQPIFLDDNMAYAWAYHIEYDKSYDDVLAAHGIKTKLEDMSKVALDSCIRGNQDGLESYFSSQEMKFDGFFVMAGIASDPAKQIKFIESINEQFQKYVKLKTQADGSGPTQERCEQANEALGVIVSTGGLLNGYWLPEVLDQLQTK